MHDGVHATVKVLGAFALVGLFLLATGTRAAAQDVHLLVVTGVGGDEEHVAQFQKWARCGRRLGEEARACIEGNIT